jgi:hypothetical protein
MNKNYVFVCALLFLVCMMGMTINVMAHPPNAVTFEFDKDTKVLKLKIAHSVDDIENHYVKGIKIFIDDTLIVSQTFRKQPNNEYQEAIYLILDASEGTILRIEATCSRFGTLKRAITLK